MNDEEVVGLAQQGDQQRYGEVVKRYEKKLFSYIKRLSNRQDEEVEDLVQETLIAAYINLQGFDCKKKFSSWIYRIAHNKVIDLFKKKQIKRESITDREELFESREKLLEDLEIERQERDWLIQAIGQLEMKYKEVVVLYYFEDKNYEEISEIIHLPTAHVGVLLFRAKNKLREIIK